MVYVERGKLAKSQECLQHAHQLAPNEDYILRHLQIVQTRISKLKQSEGMQKEKEIAFAEFDPKDFGGNILSSSIDENVDNVENTIPPPIVSNVLDGKKETRKSVSKQEKPQAAKQINHQHGSDAGAAAPSVVDESSSSPIFIEAEAISSSKIQEEYRTSNSGQNNGINRRSRYHHLQSHVPQHRPSQSMLGNDNDTPSLGLS